MGRQHIGGFYSERIVARRQLDIRFVGHDSRDALFDRTNGQAVRRSRPQMAWHQRERSVAISDFLDLQRRGIGVDIFSKNPTPYRQTPKFFKRANNGGLNG